MERGRQGWREGRREAGREGEGSKGIRKNWRLVEKEI